MKGPVAAISAVVLAFAFSALGAGAAHAEDTPPVDPIVESITTPVEEPVVEAPAEDPAATEPVEEETTLVVQGQPDTPAPPKYFVCKYVGKPGVDEVLQTGQNPISVSANAIPGYPETPVVVGSYFADAQGRSFVLAEDTGQDEPDASECPTPPPPTDVCPNIEGNQSEVPEGYFIDNEGDCVAIPEEPDAHSTYTDWVDGKWGCGDTTVEQTRERVDYTYTLVENQWVEHVSDPVIETQPRDLTADEQFSCPTELALTGWDNGPLLGGGALAILLGTAIGLARIKRAQRV
jgi:hypothetical protein